MYLKYSERLTCFAFVLVFLPALTNALTHAPEQHERHLSLVIVLTRHGDRSPLHGYPSDRLHLENWPEGVGGLTAQGTRQMYNLGQRLRKHYIDDLQFLEPTYKREDVYARSTEFDRTLMSAYSLLYGMFPVGTGDIHEVGNKFSFFPKDADQLGLPNRAQAVAIRSQQQEMDGVLIPGGWCPRHTRLQEVKRMSHRWYERMEQEEALLAQLTHATNSLHHILLDDISRVADTWNCQALHGIPLPPNGKVLGYRASLAAEWVSNYTNEGTEAHRLRAGLLLHEIQKRLRLAHHVHAGAAHADHHRLHSKFVLLSAHDTTIAAVLAALGLFDGRNPPYASTLIWELHVHKENFHDAVVRLSYNEKPLHLHGCKSEMCPLHDYIHHTEKVTVRSHAQRYRECLTGVVRLAAELAHWFIPEPLDEDDVGKKDEPHGVFVILLFMFMVGAGYVAAKTYEKRHGYLEGSLLAQRYGLVPRNDWADNIVIERRQGEEVEERVRKHLGTYVHANSQSIL